MQPVKQIPEGQRTKVIYSLIKDFKYTEVTSPCPLLTNPLPLGHPNIKSRITILSQKSCFLSPRLLLLPKPRLLQRRKNVYFNSPSP